MDRMNPLDASFLYLENGITHMHIGSCAVFEGPPPAYDHLVELFAGKLPLVPRYRQRVRFVPMNLGRPVWVDDPHFNLEYHVRHSALPAPGSDGGSAPAHGPSHVSGARPQPATVGSLGCRGSRRRPLGAHQQDAPLHGRRGRGRGSHLPRARPRSPTVATDCGRLGSRGGAIVIATRG